MKKYIPLFICVMQVSIISANLNAQNSVQFQYDKSGNRISRKVIILDKSHARKLIPKDSLVDSNNYSKLIIYPNPVKTNLKVCLDNSFDCKNTTVSMFDINGHLVHTQKPKDNVFTIDMTGYSDGIYILIFDNGVNKKEFKVVKR